MPARSQGAGGTSTPCFSTNALTTTQQPCRLPPGWHYGTYAVQSHSRGRVAENQEDNTYHSDTVEHGLTNYCVAEFKPPWLLC